MYFHRPRAMTGADIRRTITDFGRAAAQAREAGFDAVQIHAAHGYLIAGFLSPLTNRRRDEWGGDAAGRRRFLEAVYQAVRSAVGDDFAVLCKLNADDHVGMGITPRESFAAARRLAALGLDAVELSSGIFETGIYICRGRMAVDLMGRDRHPLARLWLRLAAAGQQPWVRFRENYHRPYARALKPQLPIPLILVGGIRRRTAAEALLQDGSADFVALARPLIREPGLPARWQAGRQEASACINCNRCLGAMEQGAPLRCYAGRGGSRTLAV
jgi:2,4-dienoyl-CoA reductase-like NADH-dependent reductase (Old Yellow Enzyme family)